MFDRLEPTTCNSHVNSNSNKDSKTLINKQISTHLSLINNKLTKLEQKDVMKTSDRSKIKCNNVGGKGKATDKVKSKQKQIHSHSLAMANVNDDTESPDTVSIFIRVHQSECTYSERD